MKRNGYLRIYLAVLFFVICNVTVIHAFCLSNDSIKQALLLRGLNEVHLENYTTAIKTYKKLIDDYPKHPIGYFCTAAVYKTIMQNHRVKTFENQLDSLLNLAIQVGQNAIQKDKNDASVHFYLGGAYGFLGLHKFRKRDWWGALHDGLKGISSLKGAVSIDSCLYDAYYGLGTYRYWRCARSKFLRLLFFKNDQNKGIDEIWIAIRKGKYTGIEGKYALVSVYYDYGDYFSAFSINEELFKLFPLNPSCLYMRCRLYEKQHDWLKAKDTIEKLLTCLLSSEYKSIGYEIECFYRIAFYNYELGHHSLALSNLQKAFLLKEKFDSSKELEGPLEDIGEIFEMMDRLYKLL